MRGIVLEGGGAKGAFQVGAIRALKELNIDYNVVVGASIGAINGAFIAMDDIDLLESVWNSAQASNIVEGDSDLISKMLKMDFSGDRNKMVEATLDVLRQGGIDVSPLKKLIRNSIDEEKIRKSKIRYGLVTLSLTDLKPIEVFIEDVATGKLHDLIISSANFPAFKQEKIDNKLYIDGGLFDNLPINMLINQGLDEIIAIRINGIGRMRRVKAGNDTQITMIEPSEDLGGILELDPDRIKYNIKMGYFDTLRTFQNLKGEMYYIKGEIDEDEIFEILNQIPDDVILKIAKLLGVASAPKRILFEHIMPLVADFSGVPATAGYGDILLALYEQIATDLQIDRFKVMTFMELIQLVHGSYEKTDGFNFDEMDAISRGLFSLISTRGVNLIPAKQKKEFLKYLFYHAYSYLPSKGIGVLYDH